MRSAYLFIYFDRATQNIRRKLAWFAKTKERVFKLIGLL